MLNTASEFSNSNSQRSLAHHRRIYDEDEEVIQYDHWDEVWQKNDNKTENNNEDDLIDTIVAKINSDDQLFIIETRAFLEEYRDLFSRRLNAIPADLPPLELDVDKEKFCTRTSQGPPRIMTGEKEIHMRNFITEGLEQNIIRASNATHYSQVHLVVKPSGDNGSSHAGVDTKAPRKWRTTIDYRFLNQCLVPKHWPIPNISHMLQRIGKAKPKYFAKLDMTSGYWHGYI